MYIHTHIHIYVLTAPLLQARTLSFGEAKPSSQLSLDADLSLPLSLQLGHQEDLKAHGSACRLWRVGGLGFELQASMLRV